MSEELQPLRLTAVHLEPDTGTRTVLGELEFGAGGKLTVLSADPEYKNFVEKLVRETNAREVLNVKVGGTEKFSLDAEPYARTDPNFLKGLRKFVKHYYLVDLTSDQDQALYPEEFEGVTP